MTETQIEKLRKEVIPALIKVLEKQERNAAWASRKLGITPGYMSQLMSGGEYLPSLELAFKINELVKDLEILPLPA